MREGFSFEPEKNEIHAWILPATASQAQVALMLEVLSADEAERAARFRFSHLRDSFITTRGALRYLLGRYLKVAPADVQFKYGPNGKPEVVPAGRIRFNMSHSGRLAAVAVTAGLEIGIDVEHVRALADLEHIADRFFCFDEASEIRSLAEGERDAAFFRCWTRKEAYIKAIGDGLSVPLDRFRVTMQADTPARFIHIEGDQSAAEAWTLHDLAMPPGYAGAIAYRDRPRRLSLFALSDVRELLEEPF